jgi:hypothetical protein
MSQGDHLNMCCFPNICFYALFYPLSMRPNVYDKESNFGSTMAIFKVMADCKNKFKSNQNVLKIFVFRSNISVLIMLF